MRGGVVQSVVVQRARVVVILNRHIVAGAWVITRHVNIIIPPTTAVLEADIVIVVVWVLLDGVVGVDIKEGRAIIIIKAIINY